MVNGFPMCLCEEESVHHMLLNRKMAQTVWRSLNDYFGCNWDFPKCILGLFQAWKCPSGSPPGKEM